MAYLNLLGKPWVSGGVGPDSFDCYGLVRHWYREAYGVILPEYLVDSRDLHAVIVSMGAACKSAVWSKAPLGDAPQIVAMGKTKRISHVGVHVGGGFVLHCSRQAGGVVIQTTAQLERRWSTIEIYNHIL